MSDKNTPPVIGETLSALMDDEVEQLELRRVLKNLSDDPELRAKWSRLHLISSVLHQQSVSSSGSLKFADSVLAAISNPEGVGQDGVAQDVVTGEMTSKDSRGNWRHQLTHFAVAASVAMIVVTGVQWKQHRDSEEQQVAAASVPNAALASSNQLQSLPVDRSEMQRATPSVLVSQPLAGANPVAVPVRGVQIERLMQQYRQERLSQQDAQRGVTPLAIPRANKRE
jgi:sigma-E factor negative regulatory protein RseA